MSDVGSTSGSPQQGATTDNANEDMHRSDSVSDRSERLSDDSVQGHDARNDDQEDIDRTPRFTISETNEIIHESSPVGGDTHSVAALYSTLPHAGGLSDNDMPSHTKDSPSNTDNKRPPKKVRDKAKNTFQYTCPDNMPPICGKNFPSRNKRNIGILYISR